MKIHNIIFHEVRKNKPQDEAKIFERETENSVDDHAKELSQQLSELFKKTGLYTGQFSEGDDETDPRPHFLTLLEKFYDKKSERFINFVEFSIAATKYFKKNLDESHSGKGGYLLFNHYTHNGSHFLSVVLLRKISGLSISDNLTLAEIERLDLDRLHMAARINLNNWSQGQAEKYISFRIGRSAKELTDYFSNFIGCEEATKSKIDTMNLVEVTKAYCDKHSFDEIKTQNVKEFVYERCIDWLNEDQPIYLDTLSELLDNAFNPEESGLFLEIAQDEPFFLNNCLPIEKTSLRSLTRYSGKTKKMSISFDSDLINKTVFFDEESGQLTIIDLPEGLKEQLMSDGADSK